MNSFLNPEFLKNCVGLFLIVGSTLEGVSHFETCQGRWMPAANRHPIDPRVGHSLSFIDADFVDRVLRQLIIRVMMNSFLNPEGRSAEMARSSMFPARAVAANPDQFHHLLRDAVLLASYRWFAWISASSRNGFVIFGEATESREAARCGLLQFLPYPHRPPVFLVYHSSGRHAHSP
jgi:hypothetical protein